MKKALITGFSGQDGSLLSKFLLEKGYKIIGGERRTSSSDLWRLKKLEIENDIEILPFELMEESNINSVIRKVQPDELYHLAAMSFVATSFEQPLYTGNVNALGTARILESLRLYSSHTRMFNASTSEMFGKAVETPQTENTPFYPRSPYGVSKLYAHWMVKNYREAYGMHCSSAISQNHEHYLRGPEFVTRKITIGLNKIKNDPNFILELGNLDARRDWGNAADYVEAFYLMLQQEKPDDYVISTGITHSVREFVEKCVSVYELGELYWMGEKENEVGYINDRLCIKINPKFYRPAEVDVLCGDSAKAKEKLGWSPKTSFDELVELMCKSEVKNGYFL